MGFPGKSKDLIPCLEKAMPFIKSTNYIIKRTGLYRICAIGGGGGGAGVAATATQASSTGGGGGGYASIEVFLRQDDRLAITIGAGGTYRRSDTPGTATNGGNTIVTGPGVCLIGGGGKGGSMVTTGTPASGLGGVGCGGTTNRKGGSSAAVAVIAGNLFSTGGGAAGTAIGDGGGSFASNQSAGGTVGMTPTDGSIHGIGGNSGQNIYGTSWGKGSDGINRADKDKYDYDHINFYRGEHPIDDGTLTYSWVNFGGLSNPYGTSPITINPLDSGVGLSFESDYFPLSVFTGGIRTFDQTTGNSPGLGGTSNIRAGLCGGKGADSVYVEPWAILFGGGGGGGGSVSNNATSGAGGLVFLERIMR